MGLKLLDHYFAFPGRQLPPVDESKKLDYVVAATGIFARGRRPGLEVCMPLSRYPVGGLRSISPYVQWGYPLLPARFLERMLGICRKRCEKTPTEALFHLSFSSKLESYGPGAHTLDYYKGWHLEFPDQTADDENVRPVRQGVGSSEARAIIEIHSHHHGRAEFSEKDDLDEGGNSFRVYGVLGTIFDNPTIRMRVGLFGNFFEYQAGEFFEMPAGFTVLAKEQ
jgi:hypothetical protein